MILSINGVAVSVVVNEMELNPPEGGVDWVEIYNPGNESVDIGGWTVTITDNSWVGKFPPVSAGTIIPAQGFYVFNGQSSWNHEDGGYATLKWHREKLLIRRPPGRTPLATTLPMAGIQMGMIQTQTATGDLAQPPRESQTCVSGYKSSKWLKVIRI